MRYTMRNPAGLNLNEKNPYDSELAFGNAIRTAKYGSFAAEYDEKPPTLNAFGHPMGDFGVTLHTDVAGAGGTYDVAIAFDGTGPLAAAPKIVASGGTKLVSSRWDSGSGILSGQITCLDDNGGNKFFRVSGVPSQGPTRVDVWRPGCMGVKWNPAFLDRIKPFGGPLRFMAWTATNSSDLVNWSDRPFDRDAPQRTNPRGKRYQSFESAVDLCNTTGNPPWLNVPHAASSDFIESLLIMVDKRLNPDIPCILEYSNEAGWNSNTDFQQYQWIATTTDGLIAAGDPQGLLNGTSNKFYAYMNFVAHRAMDIATIAKEFDPGRFRVVLASQWADQLRRQLEYVSAQGGLDLIEAVACAPYTDLGKMPDGSNVAARTDLTAPEIATLWTQRALIAGAQHVKDFVAVGAKFGKRTWGYEGGRDIKAFKTSIQAKYDYHLLPAMRQASFAYQQAWQSAAGVDAPFCILQLGGLWNYKNAWPLTDRIAVGGAPEYLGYVDYASAAPPFELTDRTPVVDVARLRELLARATSLRSIIATNGADAAMMLSKNVALNEELATIQEEMRKLLS
jgi:hypothetical protein